MHWPELIAPPSWRRIDLLSDVHLHEGMPRTFDAWRQHLLHTPADAVLILGDLFEVWVGDDSADRSLPLQALRTLAESSQSRALAFMPGNRDFLMGDAALALAGMTRLADPTVLCAYGQRWLLSHGDALCLADTAYQQFRTLVRAPDWQAAFLALPLAERQRQAREMREASMAHQAKQAEQAHGAAAEGWADVDSGAAAAWVAAAQAHGLIHGHTHRPGVHALPGGAQRLVLGDWDLDGAHRRARILRLSAEGMESLDLADTAA